MVRDAVGAALSRAPALLELLLPDGAAATTLIFGTGAPEGLAPVAGGREPADLALVAPDAEEVEREGWLEEAVAEAARRLGADGVLYLLLPARLRARALRLVREHRLDPLPAFLHHPGFEDTEHLVPVERPALRYWIEESGTLDRARRRIAGLALTVPGTGRVVLSVYPSVALAAQRPGGRAPVAWLASLAGAAAGPALVRAKWRGGRGSAVVTLTGNGAPVAIAKIALGGADAEKRAKEEAERLEVLGPAAREAGAIVPRGRLAGLPGGWPVLLLEPVSGTLASGLLEAGRETPARLAGRLGEWISRWNRATLQPRRLDGGWLEREVLAPAAALAPEVEAGDRYVAWLRECGAGAAGLSLPSVATHGDLTMSNLLLGEGRIGIVDWEGATGAGFPLRDFLYAAVDAESARDRHGDRVAAFERCFGDGTRPAAHLAPVLERLCRVAGLGETTALLCTQACWLQHARDERAKRASGERRPFLEIVGRLAARAVGFGTSR